MAAERRQAAGIDPPFDYPGYRSTALRAPSRPLMRLPFGPTELSGPPIEALVAGRTLDSPTDLTHQHAGAPLGERIVIGGRVLDGDGRALPGTLVEIWQANACGRYVHATDQHPAPLDPNFTGAGYCVTDREGQFSFVTIKPGAYPWKNHPNAWRPAHIHFSLFGGNFSQRLITQMYFPGDPLLAIDPIYQSIPDEASRAQLVARFDLARTVPDWALGYEFDITLGGRS
jgi:protocatechuate 3,4-dioxygenase beta subunit